MPRQKKRSTDVVQMPVQTLMGCLHEENPRIHGWDEDLPKLVKSLLWAGWCELPSFNQTNQRVIGGHGRIMACEWLIQQPKTWFLEQWQEYQSANPNASPKDKERFDAGFWLKVPVKTSEMDESLHKAMMIRLNNPTVRGTSKEDMTKLLLSRLTPAQQDLALPDPERRSRLLGAMAQKQADRLPEQMQELEQRQQESDRVTEVMQNFEPRWEVKEAEEPVVIDPEPEVTEGGAHFVEDPPPGEKKTITYPLAIILSDRRYRQLQTWMEEKGIKSDMTAFMKGHVVFKPEESEGA